MNEHLKKLARLPADYVDMHLTWQRRVLPKVAPLARGRLIDVGCGEKPYLELFAPYVDEHVGVEYGTAFDRTHAAQRARKPDVYYDGVTLPFPDASFDSAINIDVLEHTESPATVVSEIARVLKSGGVLIMTAPFSFRIHEEPHDYFRFSPHGLRLLCERAGFEVERLTPYGSLPSLIAHKINSYLAFRVARLQALGQVVGKLPHEAATRAGPNLAAVPFVVPAMIFTAAAARALEHVVDDPTESLGYLVVARKRGARG
ncbi:MAG: class I SAM-dependent methyltransferase [Polyangiaceae bacterium]|nr:class I SAM-dependent methyltransferase [Polyangiaceae bacterium]